MLLAGCSYRLWIIDATGWLLLPSLDKLAKERNEFCDKINQLLSSHNMESEKSSNSEVSEKTDRLQMHMSSLKVSKCDLGENLLLGPQRSSCRKLHQSLHKVG